MEDFGISSPESPRLSVIIPTFEVEDWVGLTVESILGQSERSLEVLVVDDGSSDGTVALVESYAAVDPRIRVLHNPGKGGAAARNHGVSQARGEFLAFADGDDTVPEFAYERLLAQADRSGNDMVIGNHLTVQPQRLISRSRSLPIYDTPRAGLTLLDEPLFLRDRVCWNRIIRRSTWNELGIQFSDAKRSNDIQAMTKAYCLIPFDVISEPVYEYRRRLGSTSMTSNKLKPEALRDHFTQELGCADAVVALNDGRVTTKYFNGVLQFDVWAHGQVALEQADDEFAEVRELLAEIVTRAPAEAVRQLPPHQQLVYGAAARHDWETARIALGTQGASMVVGLEQAGAKNVVRSVLRTDGRSTEAATWLVRASYLKAILDDPYAFTDDELVEAHGTLVSLIALGLPKSGFSWREQQVALADRSHAAYIREAATKPEPAGVRSVMFRVRRKLSQLATGNENAERALTPREAIRLASRVRPRHAKRIAGAVTRKARGLLSR